MRRLLPICAIALAIAILPSLVMAEEDRQPPMKRPGPERFFQRLDADKDGQIGLDEVPEPMKERFANLIKRADKDGDGKVSLDEMKAARRAFAQRGKRDHHKGHEGFGRDGKRDHHQGHERFDRDGKRGSKDRPARPKGKMPRPEEIFERLDKDGDGRLSLEEFKQGMRRLQARMQQRRAGPGQAPKRGPGKGHPGMRRPGKDGPKHLAMRHPGMRGPGDGGPGHFAMRAVGKGGPGMRGPAMLAKPGPGMRGANREALYHLAQYHLAMYQYHGGKMHPGLQAAGMPGKRGPACPVMGPGGKRGPHLRGPGKGGPAHLAMRGGPGMPGPGMWGPGKAGPGKCPLMKPGKRPGMRKPGMWGPGRGGPRRPHFAMIGRIMTAANKIFDKVDANKDGKVCADEAAAAHKKHFARVLKKVDKDGDEAISKNEAKVALVSLVKRFHAARAAGAMGPGKWHGMKGKKPGKVDRKKIKAAMEARFKKADKNGDGKLSRDEAPPRLAKRFSKIDTDADGQLSREELKAAFKAHRKDAARKGCPKGKKKDKKKD